MVGVQIHAVQTELFSRHASELLHWNQRINLTAITDPVEVAVKHYIDSIVVGPLIPGAQTILDIGSGGGFPGIPIKILFPDARVTLIDAKKKKISFLKHAIRKLELQGILARHRRAEDLAQDITPSKKFDVVLCRALTSLASFIAYAQPLVKDRGKIIALKGNLTSETIGQTRKKVIRQLQRSPNPSPAISVLNYELPVLNLKRSIVCIDFQASGDRTYLLRHNYD